ncbi:MAG: response regulator [SAR324 cluster bacterium]|nr:response regulator [SAR324 cluster bacterium]
MRKILSVEDDDLVRKTLAILLENEDFEVTTAIHGQDAILQLDEGSDPDILLVDNNMPVMGGLELIQRLKKDPRFQNLPVVFLSAANDGQSILQALHHGAVDYIAKPFDPDDLLKRIDRAFKVSKQIQLAHAFETENKTFNKYWNLLAALPYAEMHLKNMDEVDAISRLFANNFKGEMRSQITVGLLEALTNAVVHGNYEISSEVREQKNGYVVMQEEIDKRRRLSPYQERKVIIQQTIESEYIQYDIEDEGQGFDIKKILDPRDPKNIMRKTGRGILLMQIYFDKVEFNKKGNQVTLQKNL